MPQGVTTGTQLAFHLRTIGTGAEGGDLALLVQVEQAAHALQRQAQHRLVTGLRVDMPGHRGATAVRNQQHVVLDGPAHQLADLRRGFRVGHAIGEHTEITGAHRQPVRQALATGMAYAIFGVSHH